jgi:hypothetical protein
MSYTLIKNAFPDFYAEQLPIPIQDSVKESHFEYKPQTIEHLDTTPPTNIEDECFKYMNYILSSPKCRDLLLSRMSFAERNKELNNILPYILVVLLIILIYKCI